MSLNRLTALILATGLTACASPAYYYQATTGHLTLMKSRQDIESYLASADKDPALADRLETARGILQFAEQHLSLPSGENYSSFAITERESVVWNVVAAPEFSLDPKLWCFLVTGCVPYRGYFKEHKAEKEAGRLRDQGMDVSVSGATAYSTLGWFRDPILDSMLDMPDPQLAGTLFHELAHQRLYIKGDSLFNESFATFLEREGVHAWLLSLDDAQGAQTWRAQNQAVDQFQALLSATRGELQRIYADNGPVEKLRAEKQQALDRLRNEHDRLAKSEWQGHAWFASWFEPPPNNADLALVNSYVGGLCAFAALFEEAGRDFPGFILLAKSQAPLPPPDRAAWLQTGC